MGVRAETITKPKSHGERKSATRFFRNRFESDSVMRNSPAVAAAQQRCMRALDGKYALPRDATKRMRVENVLTEKALITAMRELPKHAAPGRDGFPSDWYACYAKELAPELLRMYHESLDSPDGLLPAPLREAHVTLIYKQNNGSREEWNNYRPISVSSAEYPGSLPKRCNWP